MTLAAFGERVDGVNRHALFRRDLPECGAIKAQEFADTALGPHDFAVHPIGGHIDKAQSYFGQECLKP